MAFSLSDQVKKYIRAKKEKMAVSPRQPIHDVYTRGSAKDEEDEEDETVSKYPILDLCSRLALQTLKKKREDEKRNASRPASDRQVPECDSFHAKNSGIVTEVGYTVKKNIYFGTATLGPGSYLIKGVYRRREIKVPDKLNEGMKNLLAGVERNQTTNDQSQNYIASFVNIPSHFHSTGPCVSPS
ncbi:hypothetical protein BBJ28_00014968 [Nothophytophthora sp. Chile5]|nr:hypothetical protein BBJ28_00014968 [Nothophytophthora sp. Chile5]